MDCYTLETLQEIKLRNDTASIVRFFAVTAYSPRSCRCGPCREHGKCRGHHLHRSQNRGRRFPFLPPAGTTEQTLSPWSPAGIIWISPLPSGPDHPAPCGRTRSSHIRKPKPVGADTVYRASPVGIPVSDPGLPFHSSQMRPPRGGKTEDNFSIGMRDSETRFICGYCGGEPGRGRNIRVRSISELIFPSALSMTRIPGPLPIPPPIPTYREPSANEIFPAFLPR